MPKEYTPPLSDEEVAYAELMPRSIPMFISELAGSIIVLTFYFAFLVFTIHKIWEWFISVYVTEPPLSAIFGICVIISLFQRTRPIRGLTAWQMIFNLLIRPFFVLLSGAVMHYLSYLFM